MNVSEKFKIPFWLHPLGFIECFSSLGVEPKRLLSAAGLPPQLLEAPHTFISLSQQIALIYSGIGQCSVSRPGLHVGLEMPWCYYGELAPVVTCSPNVAEAGAAFRRYTSIAQPAHQAFMSKVGFYLEDPRTLVVPVSTPYTDPVPAEVQQFDFDYRLAITVRLFHACGYKNADYSGLRLRLVDPHEVPLQILDRLDIAVFEPGAKTNDISANHAFFLVPWRPLRRHLYEQALSHCESAFKASGLCDSIDDQVRWLVDATFVRGAPLESVAGALHMSPRTLNRKLAITGTSFREIVYQSRMSAAMRHLRFSKMTTQQIADMMGFSSQQSLLRAVKKWSGLTSSEIRRDDDCIALGQP